jgi:hypothetical protein
LAVPDKLSVIYLRRIIGVGMDSMTFETEGIIKKVNARGASL